jgi:hypothetical protein
MFDARKLHARAALVAGLSTLALVACDRDRPSPEPPATGPAVTAPAASVDTIKEAPNRFYGKTVNVSGNVERVYSDRAFQLEGTGWAFDDNIMVLTKQPVSVAGGPLVADDELIVTGTVRPFVVADIERDLGWDLQQDLEVRLSKRPVLVAESIRKVNEYGTWSATGAAAATPITSALTIVATVGPDALVGRKVELARERVWSVEGKGLWVGPTVMSQVFVLPAAEPKDLQPGDRVRVTGTLQKVPKDAGKTWGLPAGRATTMSEDALYVDAATVTEVPASGQRPAGADRR